MSELKKCPFCGGTNLQIDKDKYADHYQYRVRCAFCHALGKVELSEEKAIESWNTRADGWINVEERLPKNNLERVLVLLKDDTFTIHLGLNKIDTDRCIDGKWVRWGNHVTYWQPLPEPPKGD